MKPDEPLPKIHYDPELSRLVGKLNRMAVGEREGGADDGAPEPVLAPPVRAASATRAAAMLPEVERLGPPAALAELLAIAVRRGASDLFLVAGAEPVVRVEGRIERLAGLGGLDGDSIRELLLPLLGRRSRESLAERRFTDFAFDVSGLGRFRANVHHEQGRLAACLRVLPKAPPKLDELGLPRAVERLADLQSGLVLVVGPAGVGKSTTLASLLARILAQRAVHAITIEEPVEYVHAHRSALVEQVEIPIDCPTFAQALWSALRQSPDVILVGEMRDPETIAAALTAAETGQLVLASLHAHTAPQAVHRVVDAFPGDQQEQVRKQLAASIAAVVAQRLLPRPNGRGRVVAAEVMLASDAVRNIIREGRIHHLTQTIAVRREEGMVTLEASLAELVRRGMVSRELALRVAYYPEELTQLLG